MIVISDTTPIISLLKADCLDLLEKLYGKVFYKEVSLARCLLVVLGEGNFENRKEQMFAKRVWMCYNWLS